MRNQPTDQPANIHHLRVGQFVVTTMMDAFIQGELALITTINEDSVAELHAASHRPTPPKITLNAYLIRSDDRTILVDTGLGVMAGDTTPLLQQNLATAGVVPEEIDTVLLTHVHPDHVGGLIDADDRPVFTNARIYVPGGELDFWMGEPPINASDRLKQQFAGAVRVLTACDDRIERLDDIDVLPGIIRIPLPGHTPDHSGYLIESQGDTLLLWADIVHMPQIQFPRPDACVAFDVDPDLAAKTRRDLFAELAASGEMFAGHHLDFPGIGHIARDRDGYRFLPHVWEPVV